MTFGEFMGRHYPQVRAFIEPHNWYIYYVTHVHEIGGVGSSVRFYSQLDLWSRAKVLFSRTQTAKLNKKRPLICPLKLRFPVAHLDVKSLSLATANCSKRRVTKAQAINFEALSFRMFTSSPKTDPSKAHFYWQMPSQLGQLEAHTDVSASRNYKFHKKSLNLNAFRFMIQMKYQAHLVYAHRESLQSRGTRYVDWGICNEIELH